MAELAKPYGGMAVTAWPDNPTSLDTAQNYYSSQGLRAVRAHALSELLQYRPVTASAITRTGDILTVTSNKVLRTAASTPSASGGVTVSGNGGTIPRYVSGDGNYTAPASVTTANVLACYDITEIELAMRIYHATRASAVASGLTFAGGGETTGVYYEYGNWAIGTNSDNYFPVLDLANQDDTNGSFYPVALADGFGVSSIYGVVWVRASGVA